MLVTFDTSHLEMSMLKDCALKNIVSMLVTRDTFHLEMSALKDCALENILYMLTTLDTSHLEMSVLKDFALSNIDSMLVTRDTSHSPIGPRPFAHSPTDEASKHVSTAALSSALVFGAECMHKWRWDQWVSDS